MAASASARGAVERWNPPHSILLDPLDLLARLAANAKARSSIVPKAAHKPEPGRYADQADVARHHGLTRARLTQLMNLLLLAPDIQEEVLALEYPAGREPITERTLRRLLESLVWEDQRALWAELRAVAG